MTTTDHHAPIRPDRARRRWPRTVAALAGVLLLVGAGCGDDDDGDASAATPTTSATSQDADDTTTSEAAEADLAAYCEASLAVETAGEPDIDFETATEEEITEAFQTFAADTLRPLVDDALAVIPEEIAEDGTTVSDAMDQLIETGDPSGFDAPEFAAAEGRLHQFDLDSCGWGAVTFSTVEYAFEDLPETLSAGPVSFDLQNDGTEVHELVLMRKNDGVTLSAEELLALPEEEAEAMVTLLGIAEPVSAGETSYLIADLVPGDYVALCFIPTGATALDGPPPEGPPHFVHGMVQELTVT